MWSGRQCQTSTSPKRTPLPYAPLCPPGGSHSGNARTFRPIESETRTYRSSRDDLRQTKREDAVATLQPLFKEGLTAAIVACPALGCDSSSFHTATRWRRSYKVG